MINTLLDYPLKTLKPLILTPSKKAWTSLVPRHWHLQITKYLIVQALSGSHDFQSITLLLFRAKAFFINLQIILSFYSTCLLLIRSEPRFETIKPGNAKVFWSSFLVSDDGDNKKPVDVVCAVQITFLIKIFSASKC